MKEPIKPSRGWAWAIQNTRGEYKVSCWAHSTREQLVKCSDGLKPSDEAKMVWVDIVPRQRRTKRKKVKP